MRFLTLNWHIWSKISFFLLLDGFSAIADQYFQFLQKKCCFWLFDTILRLKRIYLIVFRDMFSVIWVYGEVSLKSGCRVRKKEAPVYK